jgi:hypothetical protein
MSYSKIKHSRNNRHARRWKTRPKWPKGAVVAVSRDFTMTWEYFGADKGKRK